jgi:hypothetical protein
MITSQSHLNKQAATANGRDDSPKHGHSAYIKGVTQARLLKETQVTRHWDNHKHNDDGSIPYAPKGEMIELDEDQFKPLR